MLEKFVELLMQDSLQEALLCFFEQRKANFLAGDSIRYTPVFKDIMGKRSGLLKLFGHD